MVDLNKLSKEISDLDNKIPPLDALINKYCKELDIDPPFSLDGR